jgi:hypothetical protein
MIQHPLEDSAIQNERLNPQASGTAPIGDRHVPERGVGALVGAGIPEERVKEYESGLKAGDIVMGGSRARRKTERIPIREWGGDHADTVSAHRGL